MRDYHNKVKCGKIIRKKSNRINKYSKEFVSKLLKMKNDGMTFREIGKIFNMNSGGICSLFKRNNYFNYEKKLSIAKISCINSKKYIKTCKYCNKDFIVTKPMLNRKSYCSKLCKVKGYIYL